MPSLKIVSSEWPSCCWRRTLAVAALLLLHSALFIERAEATAAAHTNGNANETMPVDAEDGAEEEKRHLRRLTTVMAIGAVVAMNLSYYQKFWQTAPKRFGMPVMYQPPQGGSWPLLGQALNFIRYRPWDLLSHWHRCYGPIVCFPLLSACMFSIGSPGLLKQVLQSKIAAVKKDVANTMKPFLVILGTGIVTSENEAWLKQRLKMSQPLRKDVLEIIPQQTLFAVQRLFAKMDRAAAAQASEEKDGDGVDSDGVDGDGVDGDGGEGSAAAVPMGSCLRHLTLQVISGTFLSLSAEESDSTFARMYLPIVDESNIRVWHPYRAYLFVLPAFWMYLYNTRRLNRYVSKLIRQRWELRRQEEAAAAAAAVAGAPQDDDASRQQDILDRVLAVYEKECIPDPCPEVLPNSVVKQFRDEMKTFMLAGHETSAAMMTWTIYELMGNETLFREVAAEGQSIFRLTSNTNDWRDANVSDLPPAEELAKLVLSEACLKESLRKYSVVPIVARRTIQDLRLTSTIGNNAKEYFIPKGSSIIINIQAVHHDPANWPRPLKFDPDRFLEDNPNAAKKDNDDDEPRRKPKLPADPYTFLPFIAGPRNCLGQHLALLESKMVIAMLAQRYNFSLPKGCKVHVEGWDFLTSQGQSQEDPRHRFMVPVIPKQELLVMVSRKEDRFDR